jgi:hypothetical protein
MAGEEMIFFSSPPQATQVVRSGSLNRCNTSQRLWQDVHAYS